MIYPLQLIWAIFNVLGSDNQVAARHVSPPKTEISRTSLGSGREWVSSARLELIADCFDFEELICANQIYWL